MLGSRVLKLQRRPEGTNLSRILPDRRSNGRCREGFDYPRQLRSSRTVDREQTLRINSFDDSGRSSRQSAEAGRRGLRRATLEFDTDSLLGTSLPMALSDFGRCSMVRKARRSGNIDQVAVAGRSDENGSKSGTGQPCSGFLKIWVTATASYFYRAVEHAGGPEP